MRMIRRKVNRMRYIFSLLVLIFSVIDTVLAYSPDSLYSLPMNWRDDHNNTTELAKFAGKSVVLAMVYTSCRSVCPLIIKKLKSIEDAGKEKGKIVNFVLVSLDPENDNAEVLARFRKREGLPETNWVLLSGSNQDTRKLSNLIGFSYQKNTGSGEIMHSNKITVLNSEGEISYALEGLNDEITELLEKL